LANLQTGKLEKANEHLNASRVLGAEHKMDTNISYILYLGNLAEIQYTQGNVKEAIEIIKEARKYAWKKMR